MILCFLSTYCVRWALTQFFVMKCEAEKTGDALNQILENLPDGVLMFESGSLSYLNSQADKFFGTSVSQLPSEIKKSQYQIMDYRCMYELSNAAEGAA